MSDLSLIDELRLIFTKIHIKAWNAAIEAAIDKINARGSYGDENLADSLRELMK